MGGTGTANQSIHTCGLRVVHDRPVRRGGSRGFGRTPYLAGYTYYLCDRLTLDDGLSSKDDGWRSVTARV